MACAGLLQLLGAQSKEKDSVRLYGKLYCDSVATKVWTTEYAPTPVVPRAAFPHASHGQDWLILRLLIDGLDDWSTSKHRHATPPAACNLLDPLEAPRSRRRRMRSRSSCWRAAAEGLEGFGPPPGIIGPPLLTTWCSASRLSVSVKVELQHEAAELHGGMPAKVRYQCDQPPDAGARHPFRRAPLRPPSSAPLVYQCLTPHPASVPNFSTIEHACLNRGGCQ